MTPSRFLHDIYGPGLIYSGYAPVGASRWLSDNRTALLAITGNQLSIVGDMPILCAAGTATPASLELLEEAGLCRPANLHVFHDEADYAARLAELTGTGQRIVIQHRHPAAYLPANGCWISPELLSWLNDKGNLAELVAPAHVPERRVVESASCAWPQPGLKFPCVLKAATRQSTGGGAFDIHRCDDAGALEIALTKLQDSERLVIEQWLPAHRFLCLNYAIDHCGDIAYLGTTEIINEAGGAYLGNWLGESCTPAATIIELGREIARNGAEAGYMGCLCIDVAELPDGRALVLDLNFRACGSTVPLLLFNAIRKTTGASIARYRNWLWEGDFRSMIDAARHALRSGFLIPIVSFDPGTHGLAGPARLNSLLLGGSREEITAREQELVSRGWI